MVGKDLDLGLVAAALRVVDGQRVQAEVLDQQGTLGFGIVAFEVEPQLRIGLGLPGGDQLVAACRDGARRGAVEQRADQAATCCARAPLR